MPIIAAGLAWLATAIAGLFTLLIEFFTVWITKRTLIAAAMISAYGAITLAVFSTLSITLSTVLMPTLPTGFHQAAGMFLPDNTYTCLTAVITSYVIRWVYDQQIRLLDYSAK